MLESGNRTIASYSTVTCDFAVGPQIRNVNRLAHRGRGVASDCAASKIGKRQLTPARCRGTRTPNIILIAPASICSKILVLAGPGLLRAVSRKPRCRHCSSIDTLTPHVRHRNRSPNLSVSNLAGRPLA